MQFPAEMGQVLIGKTIASIEQLVDSDEGWRITFRDGTYLEFSFSGCEGTVNIGLPAWMVADLYKKK